MKSGFVAIIGRPNAGKSTLLNTILGEKIAITTPKAQTTRNAILGIYNREDLQIVFIDTPGIHKAETNLGSYMNKEALSQAAGVDVIYYIADGSRGLRDEDQEILEKLFSYEIPVFYLVNKTDVMSRDELIERLAYAGKNYDFAEIIPISALSNDNIDDLLETTEKYLHDDIRYFPEDAVSSMSRDFRISEIIREKVIMNTEQEVPHLAACQVEEVKETEKKMYIEATIICNKPGHKGIIIGRGGSMLKKINDAASKDLKELFGKKIILSLYVRVEEDWLNKDKRLFELGYFRGDQDE
ncbi:MAG: GTPase Era [Erysipelotrichaceae bacterium]|nr:GTPase Era [Erysipelotrichaceae bacterium]